MLPEMSIYNPASHPVAEAVAQMAYESESPVIVRLDKGKLSPLYDPDTNFKVGLGVLREGEDICIISTGTMVHRALEVAEKLAEHSISATVVDLYRLKPVNEKLLLKCLSPFKRVVTLEDNSIVGGLGSIISELLTDNEQTTKLKRIALRDEQCLRYGQKDWLHESYQIDALSIIKQIENWYSAN